MKSYLQLLSGGIGVSLLSLAVSLATTVWLAPRIFYRQRWWERQADQYAKAVELLSRLDSTLGELRAGAMESVVFGDAYRDKLNALQSDASRELTEMAFAAALTLSCEAETALLAVAAELNDDSGRAYYDSLDAASAAVTEGRHRLIDLAMRDLNLPRRNKLARLWRSVLSAR